MDEYVTDVTYVRSFEKELAPSRLRLAAALNGFPTSAGDDFDYCELGVAHGDTMVALAAANPRARFVGVDLNREHVASAGQLAKDSGLGNVRFVERDFADLDGAGIPDLDFLCAHGVMSWVGPEKRRAILELAARRLKPGGLLYVSYNAMPGWAALEPLRQLVVSGGAGGEGDSLERARRGLAFAKQMNEAGAEYFSDNPAAQAMLVTMEKAGLAYIVHEYLNAYWTPMYFAQVATELSSFDLHFAGQLPLYLNYRDLAIPKSLTALFGRVADRPTFEGLKDFALNEFFRRDVYIKGAIPRSTAATQAWLEATPFALLDTASTKGERAVALPHHTLVFEGALFDALFAALGEGAQTSTALAARPELAPFGEEQVRAALLRMLLGGHVAPAQHATLALPTTGRLRIPSSYNRGVIERALTSNGPHVLASPVLGTGISIPLLRAIALRLRTEVPPGQHQAWLREHFENRALELKIGDRVIEDRDELRRLVQEELTSFVSTRLARFVDLGILEREA